MTIHVQIGNSDDKLPQRAWASFVSAVDSAIATRAVEVHGRWFSAPAEPWQSAAWTFEAAHDAAGLLCDALRTLAREYGQDSIAWTEGATHFLAPSTPEPEPVITHTYTLNCEYGRMRNGEWCDQVYVWEGPAADVFHAHRRAVAAAQIAGWQATSHHDGTTTILCPGREPHQ